MKYLFQVRMKTCEDEGNVFRSDANVYTNYDNAIMALRAEVHAYEQLLKSHHEDVRIETVFHPDLNNYRAELLIENVTYLQAWIEPLTLVQPAINEHTAAALLEVHKRNTGRLLNK